MRVDWQEIVFLGVLCVTTACDPTRPGGDKEDPGGGLVRNGGVAHDGGATAEGGPVIVLPDGGVIDGAERYATLCASCHGARGEGASAPRLDDGSYGRSSLMDVIDQGMPLGAPADCTGPCAMTVADFLLALSGPVSCEERVPPARQLRLLTRREYERTVHDLLRPLFPS